MRTRTILLLLGLAPWALATDAVYHTTADWKSSSNTYSTGAALVDLNRDGWLDLVISNGNDMRSEKLAVYYNRGDGTFSAAADWQSDDRGYHGHLDVADVNGDGWPDVAVSLLLNEGGPAAKLYLNHEGKLSSKPDWTSSIKARSFGVAFGDVNNDGRPDLAIAVGWGYDPGYEGPKVVYLNVDGQLDSSPAWQSDDKYEYLGVLWTDADNDGWLDLVGIATGDYTYIYRNIEGMLETTASWHTTDAKNQDSIMGAAGDVTGDGLRELFVTDNTQLSGTGYFRQYNGLSDGFFSTTPDWKYYDGYGSALALADVDGDGLLDLATGAWWDRTRLFLNKGTGFGATPDWNSAKDTVVEKIVFGDIDKNGLRTVREQFTPRRLIYLAHQPIQSMGAVRVDGVELTATQYFAALAQGWLTVGLDAQNEIEVEYRVSTKLDMAVANWDPNDKNQVYYNLLVVPGDANCDAQVDFDDIDPFVLMLTDPAQYQDQFPGCAGLKFCDMNKDGSVDFDDIDGFVAALTG